MKRIAVIACLAFSLFTAPASAQGTVAVLMPGAGGAVPSDFLMRNRSKIEGASIPTVVAVQPGEAVAAVKAQKAKGHKVVLVGMSRGTLFAAAAIKSGARPDALVLVSGIYGGVRGRLGAASLLPPTLIVHHRNDACPKTPPGSVGGFVQWSGGKASVRWIANDGNSPPNPCGPRGAHGFYMKDGAAVGAIVSFIKSR
jgi:hypothetical protein